jgi:anti-sigma factor RsiW
MIDCEWVQDQIESSIDGELSRAELAGFESHLSVCPACREEWEFAKEIKENLAGLPQPSCPERVAKAVWEKISKREKEGLPVRTSLWGKGGGRLWGWRPAFAAGCAMVFAIGLWSVFHQPPAPQQATEASKPLEAISPQDLALATRQVEVTLAYVEHVGRQSLLAAGNRVFELVVVEQVKKAQARPIKDGARPAERPSEN